MTRSLSCSTDPLSSLCYLFPSISSSVDMSDVVPPEVRPKPVVPAKPPNVGAPSPSSPFPPQGLGIGGGGINAPPPSAIPVPIGSHPQSHVGSHGVGHGGGHAGAHPAAHSVGHGHGGSHSSTGGSTLLGYIGIDTIIEQMRKKTMKTGFDFNIMVVGESYWTFFRLNVLTLYIKDSVSEFDHVWNSSQVTAALESQLW